jgi:hypothetical protein
MTYLKCVLICALITRHIYIYIYIYIFVYIYIYILVCHNIRPIEKHNATTWMLGHMLGYIHNNRNLTMKDYLDFLKRARWK